MPDGGDIAAIGSFGSLFRWHHRPENGAGKDLGREQLHVPLMPGAFGLLKRLTDFRGNRHSDDETLLVLQCEKESAPISAWAKERVKTFVRVSRMPLIASANWKFRTREAPVR